VTQPPTVTNNGAAKPPRLAITIARMEVVEALGGAHVAAACTIIIRRIASPRI